MKLTSQLRYLLWSLNGRFGRQVSVATPHKATVLITYYNPLRMEQMEAQIRNVLKCDFVEKLVISNHNPEIQIAEMFNIADDRIEIVEQTTRRGCGYRWFVAQTIQSRYIIVIDDDIWLYPSQLATLFQHLVDEPEMPHGLCGMIIGADGAHSYRESEEMAVDFLTELYAVTQEQVHRYVTLEQQLRTDGELSRLFESVADFMLISSTGKSKPKIHRVGPIRRSPSFNQAGVAVHKEGDFAGVVNHVNRVLQTLE